jgi:hypothetical protein
MPVWIDLAFWWREQITAVPTFRLSRTRKIDSNQPVCCRLTARVPCEPLQISAFRYTAQWMNCPTV